MIEQKVIEASLDQVKQIHKLIPEFKDSPDYLDTFTTRAKDTPTMVIIGRVDSQSAGYMIAYPHDPMSQDLYCWMSGVDLSFRERGVYKQMAWYREQWARHHGFNRLTLKTRNKNRAILSYLVNHNWDIIDMHQQPDVKDNRILFEKYI